MMFAFLFELDLYNLQIPVSLSSMQVLRLMFLDFCIYLVVSAICDLFLMALHVLKARFLEDR